MLSEIARRFRRFADEAARDSSPLYARLARDAADDPDVLGLLLLARPEQRLPMLLFAAVHHELIADPRAHPLAAHYPCLTGGAPPPVEDPYPRFADFCRERAADLRALCATRRTQTNETGRSAVLRPCLTVAARREPGRPLALIECGASAGLNLNWDHYLCDYGGGLRAGPPTATVVLECALQGSGRPPLAAPAVAWRRGIDLEPLDPADPDDARWLRACVWPDQPDRMSRLDAALDIAREHPPQVERGDALERLPELIAAAPADALVVVFHSAFTAYLTRWEEERLEQAIGGAGRPVVHVALESPRLEHGARPGEPLRFDLRVDGERVGTAAPHGQALSWTER